ncbi:NAD(P)/FAD-dependent oxidoreductase [Bradyrhizobium sp. 33ap4]|uniref:NAD(P)/FAD-dependent oxidoreductase n=1 Tax=Bradyrhizobium sp. 33ap4 TaxID=3061630 RepID=UPI00292F03DE|nr:FAD-dependent monooxygenase [Bradyrhizobium sp. 33ap4]
MPQLRAEFLVAGAGPSGLTIARLLALKGRGVVVVDPGPSAAGRLELLAPAALGTVDALGLSSLLSNPAIARPCLGIRRWWDSGQPEHEDFLRHPRRTGHVVDRASFDRSLRDAAAAAGVVFVEARVTGLVEGGVRLAIGRGVSETLAFGGTLIDATGRVAMVARRKGARIAIRDRRVAELIEESALHSDSVAPVWLDVRKHDETSWSYRIEGPVGKVQIWRIRKPGTATAPDALRRVDSSASILTEMAGESWLAVGDAACAFDPIASQGLFNALSSALVSAGALQVSGRLTCDAARAYSGAVAAAFLFSEAGRSQVYRGRGTT